MNAQKIKERFDFYANNTVGVQYPPSAASHGVYVGAMNKACKGDANRKLVLKYLTGKTSTKTLSDKEWIALKKMVDISPAELERLCGIILAEVVKQDDQLELISEVVK